jgi:hypothetical protein
VRIKGIGTEDGLLLLLRLLVLFTSRLACDCDRLGSSWLSPTPA